jgi:Fic/DOC family
MMPRDVPLVEDLAEVAVTRLRAAAGDAGEARLRRLGRRLLLKDSKSTFLIENETPSLTMAQRWGEEIANAGSVRLDLVLMTRLQKLLMSERRFMVTGLRRAGVFLGDRIDDSPAPVWIGARPEDLQNLMDGLVETNRRMAEGSIHPVVQAAITAFGMVLIHPFEDGNGRLHRYLLQHVLGERGVAPCGVALPLSKAISNDIEGYVEALESCQTDRLGLIEWKPTANGNVDVTNDTADLYRYFDASVHGRFLMKCIDRVFERDIPQELIEMDRRDRVVKGVRDILDMPDTMVDKFIQFMLQNDGKLSKAKRTKEFSQLTDEEVVAMQDLVRETYEIADAPSADLPTP